MIRFENLGKRAWLCTASVAAAAALLGGCNRPGNMPSSPRTDAVVSQDGKTPSQVGADVRQDARDAGKAVANKAKDVSITTEVNTLLARDAELSALKINVDTSDGHVVLQGSAPTDAARARAADLARSVGGVLEVDNKLQVQGR